MSEHVINYGNEISQTLPGTRSRRQDIRHILIGNANCLLLMEVKCERFTEVILMPLYAKDSLAILMEHALGNEGVDARSRLERWIELNQGIRPE